MTTLLSPGDPALNSRYEAFLATKPTRTTTIEYIIWINGRWSAWRSLRGIHPDATITMAQHEQFDRWLASDPSAEGRR